MSDKRRPRLWVSFSQERFDLFEQWAKELELPMANLVAMCAWTGSKVFIPSVLPDKHRQLELLVEQEQQDRAEAAYEAYLESTAIDPNVLDLLQQHQEEFKQWLQERDLHKNEA